MRFISENPADMRPVWMSQNEIEVPDNLLKQFFQDFSLTDCRFFLWQMLSASVATENKNSQAGNGELIYFFENLTPAIEAMYLVVKTQPPSTLEASGESVSSQINISQDCNQRLKAEPDVKVSKNSPNALAEKKWKKISKRVRRNSIWFKEKINDPYQVVSSFIDGYSLEEFNNYLLGILEACSLNHFYQKASPADVLHFFENLESIINASYLVYRMSDRDDDFGGSELLAGCCSNDLTKFLVGFFDYKSLEQWKQDLSEICNFSLSNQAAHLWVDWIDTLAIYTGLTKLVELLHKNTKINPYNDGHDIS